MREINQKGATDCVQGVGGVGGIGGDKMSVVIGAGVCGVPRYLSLEQGGLEYDTCRRSAITGWA